MHASPPTGDSVLALMKQAKGRASISFDPNVRAGVLPPRDAGACGSSRRAWRSRRHREGERAGHGLALSRHAIRWPPWRRGAPLGPRLAILTQGARRRDRLSRRASRSAWSAAARRRGRQRGRGGRVHRRTSRDDGGIQTRWGREAPLRALRDPAQLRSWLAFAAAAGAWTCGQRGAQAPNRAGKSPRFSPVEASSALSAGPFRPRPPAAFSRSFQCVLPNAPSQMREVTIERGVARYAEGSCLVKFGETHVLCTASLEDKPPQWLRGQGRGWVTAEYSMLPRATHTRTRREITSGKPSGRTQEIQRLIGRSLRAVSTSKRWANARSRSIAMCCRPTAARARRRSPALGRAARLLEMDAWPFDHQGHPLRDHVAAVSCGISQGRRSSISINRGLGRGNRRQFRHDRRRRPGRNPGDRRGRPVQRSPARRTDVRSPRRASARGILSRSRRWAESSALTHRSVMVCEGRTIHESGGRRRSGVWGRAAAGARGLSWMVRLRGP